MDDANSPTKKAKYIHIDGDDNFHERSTAVFSCLDSLEPVKEGVPPKKPGRRFPHRVPDHVLHPEKWTKYSLEEDVTGDYQAVSGDVANRNIALSFLDDVKKRKASESKSRATSNSTAKVDDSKILFSKDVVKSKAEVHVTGTSETQSRVRGRVNIMPEYVVGQTPKMCSKTRVSRRSDACSAADEERDVGLEHLQEQDAESSVLADKQQEEMAGEKVAFTKRKNRGRKAIRKPGAEELDESTAIE